MDQVKEQDGIQDNDIWSVHNFIKEGYNASEFTNTRTGEKKYLITVYCYLEGYDKPMADTVWVKEAKTLEEAFGARERLTEEFKVKVKEEIKRVQELMRQQSLLVPNASQAAQINAKAGLIV